MSDGRVVYTIGGDHSEFSATIDKAKSVAQNGFDAISKMGAAAFNAVQNTGSAAFGALSTAAAAIATSVGVAAVQAYADYEQLIGGVETLFGDASKTVSDSALRAFESAGLSANDYMETVTSFAASLISSLEGDTVAAANVSDRAISDMADNANKMGTAMEAIQNAYQGFAKQNYTMLDNLKLGYGGTQTEMARLISDAARLTDVQAELGVTVDASSMSFANVVNAISVMQKQMGITGTTAKEASTTITGSLNMTKAAWENLLTAFGVGSELVDESVDNLTASAMAFLDNLLPLIESMLPNITAGLTQLTKNIMAYLPKMFAKFAPTIAKGARDLIKAMLTAITEALPQLVAAGENVLDTLITAMRDALPQIQDIAAEIAPLLVDGFLAYESIVLELGASIIMGLIEGITQNLDDILGTAKDILERLVAAIIDNLPVLVDAATQITQGLCSFIVENIDLLVDGAIEIVHGLVEYISNNLDALLDACMAIITAICDGLIEYLPELVTAATEIIIGLANYIVENLDQLLQCALDIIVALVNGLIENIPALADAAVNIVAGLAEFLVNSLDPLADAALSIINKLLEEIEANIPALGYWCDYVKEQMGYLVDFLIGILTGDWSRAWSGLSGAAIGALNLIIDAANEVITMINDILTAASQLVNAFGGNVDWQIDYIDRITLPTTGGGGLASAGSGAGRSVTGGGGSTNGGGAGRSLPTAAQLQSMRGSSDLAQRYAVGEDYVMHDWTPAYLDRGERVLTAEENRLFTALGGVEAMASKWFLPELSARQPITVLVNVQGSVDVDGYELGQIMLRNLDDAAHFTLRG